MQIILLLFASLAFVPMPGAAAATPEIERAAVPGWVKPVEVDLSTDKMAAGTSGGQERLLVDRQVNAADATRYVHVATRFLTGNGVEEGGRISITFDPSYETLAMHRLIVYRDGKASDRLARQEIKVIQREERLDWHLYDGRLTVEIILEDIRVGDVLEFGYSIHGWNPIFANHYVDAFYTERNEPVHDLRNRLLWPSDRHLGIKDFGARLAPTVTVNGPVTEYVWERHDAPAVIADGEAPQWFEPLSWIEFSEFDSWEAVARWANGIYIVPGAIPEELEKECQGIAREETEPARVLAALRYVQDNFRYLGLEVGVNSHKPYPIETILARRFGDCKDKALLLCTMLRRLGFDASPSLVGTDFRQTIGEWLPSPLAFDHLVVQLSLHGKTIWLDPTWADQGGALEQLYFPPYGWALVISPKTTALTAVTASGLKEASREVFESFTFPDFQGTATLHVKSTWRGLEADKVRYRLAQTSREEMQKEDLNGYARLYPQVEAADTPQFQDDRAKDEIVANETYRVSGFWKPDDEESGRLRAVFASQLMRDLADRPSTRVRTAPYGLSYPENAVHVIEINTPRALTLNEEHLAVENPAFGFTYAATLSRTRFTLRYTYESRSDNVPAKAITKYVEDIERMRNQLSYRLSVPTEWGEGDGVTLPTWSGPSGSRSWAAWLWVGLTAAVAVAVYGWKRITNRAPAPALAPSALHRCVVCGETEESNPALEFRVAVDGSDYCHRHLPARPGGAR